MGYTFLLLWFHKADCCVFITEARAMLFQRKETGSCEAEPNTHIFKIKRGLACHGERKTFFNSSAGQCRVT